MKKRVVLLVCLLVPAFLFAAITGTGIGKTETEAYNDALLVLGKQVSISFTGIDFETTSVNNNELMTSEYTSRNLASSSVEFFGLESSTRKTSSGYEVTLTIPDSAAGLYKARLSELEVDIDALKKVVDSGTDDVKLRNLPSLYKLVTSYEAYRSIMVRLDPTYVPKALSIGSSTGIKAQYSALYSIQSQKDNLTLQQYNYEVSLGIITVGSEKIYQDALREIEQRQNEYLEMQSLISDNFAQKAAELELQVSSMRDSLQAAAVDIKRLEGATTISGAINSVEAYKNSFHDFKNELDIKLGAVQKEYDSQKKTIVERALTQAVTDSDWENGKLKAGSRTQLENAVRGEVDKVISGYQKSAAVLFEDGFNILKLIVQNADATAKDISSKTLTTSSLSDPSLNVEVDINSFAENQWQAKAVLNVLGYEIEVPFNITYYAWTGSEASSGTIDERINFNKMKSSWESLFADYANQAMNVVLSMTVKTDVHSEGYDLTVTNYEVVNTSNGKTVASGTCDIRKRIIVKGSEALMDFSLENDILLVSAPPMKTGTDYARYYRILTEKEISSLGNIVSPDYNGLNSKDERSINLFRRNSFDLNFGERTSSVFKSWNHYDDVIITFDANQLEYSGSVKYTLEKTTTTTKVGKLYYWFDDGEIFHLYDSPHTWQTLRFQHSNSFRFRLKDDAEFGATSLTAVMMQNSEKVYEGTYTINVQRPNLDVSRTYCAVYYDNNSYVYTNSVDTLTGQISPTQTMKIRYGISSSGLNDYGGQAINGMVVKYDESKYSVTVTQDNKLIVENSVSRDGNIATAHYTVSPNKYLDIELTMKMGTPAGKDTMQLWYTTDEEKASATIIANIEASTTAWK